MDNPNIQAYMRLNAKLTKTQEKMRYLLRRIYPYIERLNHFHIAPGDVLYASEIWDVLYNEDSLAESDLRSILNDERKTTLALAEENKELRAELVESRKIADKYMALPAGSTGYPDYEATEPESRPPDVCPDCRVRDEHIRKLVVSLQEAQERKADGPK